MANTAVCIRCGHFKYAFLDLCVGCNFEPSDPVDIAKSRILGEPYSFALGSEGEVLETGRTSTELLAISEQIGEGVPYSFPEEELNGVLTVYRQVQATTPHELIIATIKWLTPPVLLAAVLFFAGFF